MDKPQYFLAALKAQCFLKKAWVCAAFSLTREAPGAWKHQPYPYRLVAEPNGYFYVDPEHPDQLLPIEDAPAGKPLFQWLDGISLEPGDLPNLPKGGRASYGTTLMNQTVLCYPFGPKIEFQWDAMTPRGLEKLILPRFRDDPVTPDTEPPSTKSNIYVTEYLRFTAAMFYMTSFTQISTPAATRKTMTAAPGIIALRENLLKEHKDMLDDPVVIAKIQAELVKHDKAYLKGDAGEGFLISGKAFAVVRQSLYGMIGAQKTMGGNEFKTVKTSLAEGWDASTFTLMNNTSRSGSFDRGAETQLGGESVKWLLRASSNMNIAADDCGVKLGNPQWITEDRHNTIGFGVVSEKGTVVLTEENYGEYLGKKVMIRSPAFCKGTITDYCKMCVGPRLSVSPTGLSNAVSQYGNTFMLISLGNMHGKQLSVAHMDFMKELT